MIDTHVDRKWTADGEVLQQRVAELEQEVRRLAESEKEKAKLEHSLKERVKELNCLYGIAELVEQSRGSLDTLFQGTVELLPPSWQYPEITCGRITFESRRYLTRNFTQTQWRQGSPITVVGEQVGVVEVYYLEKMPELGEGPFLKEERLLIDAVAERLGKVAERIRAQKQLEVERTALKDMNIALREVLAKIQDEKREVGKRVQANIDKVVMPILLALENEVSHENAGYIRLIKRNLADIASPFVDRLSGAFMSLTPSEIRICNMIRGGLSTKEIARLRHLAPATVSRHREHIRKKLGLVNEMINLATYLQNFMSQNTPPI